MSKKKAKLSKPVAIILVLLMMGSTIGMLLSIFLNPSEEIELPNRITKYKLTDPQIKELINNYHTVIEYEYPSGCLECGTLLNSLEYWTSSSENQIYLQEIQIDTGSSSKLTIISLRGQETLHNPSQDEARDTICDLLISRSLFCVEI